MKCPEHNVEMNRIAETVNAYDGTSVYWLCEGIGRYPRKHVLMTEDWLGCDRFYEPEWKKAIVNKTSNTAVTESSINEENMSVLNSILGDGFMYIDDAEQPTNINQVIWFLLKVADDEGYLKREASELLEKYKQKERYGVSKC